MRVWLRALICFSAMSIQAVAQTGDSVSTLAIASTPKALLTVAAEPDLSAVARLTRNRLNYPEQYRCMLANASQGRSLRLVVAEKSSLLIAKRFDLAKNVLLEEKRYLVPAARLNLFRAYLKIANLGSLTSQDLREGNSARDWWLETARHGNYRSYARRSPLDMYFREVCLLLSRSAGDEDSEHLFTNPKTGFTTG